MIYKRLLIFLLLFITDGSVKAIPKLYLVPDISAWPLCQKNAIAIFDIEGVRVSFEVMVPYSTPDILQNFLNRILKNLIAFEKLKFPRLGKGDEILAVLITKRQKDIVICGSIKQIFSYMALQKSGDMTPDRLRYMENLQRRAFEATRTVPYDKLDSILARKLKVEMQKRDYERYIGLLETSKEKAK